MNDVIVANPKVMHGTPCFSGTRVPVDSLFQHLKLGYTVDGFLHQFPTVKREQVEAVLEMASNRLSREPSESVAR